MGGRYFHRCLKSIGVADPHADILPLTQDLIRRMRKIRHLTNGGTYVLADSNGRVYVLAEQTTTTTVTLKQHLALVVGLYCSGGPRHPIFPTPEQLKADLVQHFIDIGMLSESAIYAAIRDAEG